MGAPTPARLTDRGPSGPRILVDARFRPDRKGGDRCRYELARHLPATGTGYAFVAYDDTAATVRAGAPGCDVIETSRRPWDHPGGDLYEHVGLPRAGRRLRAEVYHGTFNVLPAVSGLRPARRMVVTIHDVAVFKMPEAYSRKFGLLARFLMRCAVRRADRIIAISSATRADLVDLFPSAGAKTRVILNGVGDEFMRAADLPPTDVAAVTKRLNLPDPYVLYVGNLERKKNLPRLVSAFARSKAASGLPHRLVIVGERPPGVPEAGLDGAVRDGLVVFTGFLPDGDLPAVYRGADLVAYPSLYEGFGMPVLEGMAAGVPVLTSAVSSMPEVAGGAAMLIDPLSIDSIASGMSVALTDAAWRREAVARGRQRAGELSWAVNARRTAEVYGELVER